MIHLPSLYYFTEMLSVISEASELDSTAAEGEETGEEYCNSIFKLEKRQEAEEVCLQRAVGKMADAFLNCERDESFII